MDSTRVTLTPELRGSAGSRPRQIGGSTCRDAYRIPSAGRHRWAAFNGERLAQVCVRQYRPDEDRARAADASRCRKSATRMRRCRRWTDSSEPPRYRGSTPGYISRLGPICWATLAEQAGTPPSSASTKAAARRGGAVQSIGRIHPGNEPRMANSAAGDADSRRRRVWRGAASLSGRACRSKIAENAGGMRIKQVMPDSPAEQAGLSAGMLIQQIDDMSTAGKSPQTARLCSADRRAARSACRYWTRSKTRPRSSR